MKGITLPKIKTLKRHVQTLLQEIVYALTLLGRSLFLSALLLIVLFPFIIDADMLNGLATITQEELMATKQSVMKLWLLLSVMSAAFVCFTRAMRMDFTIRSDTAESKNETMKERFERVYGKNGCNDNSNPNPSTELVYHPSKLEPIEAASGGMSFGHRQVDKHSAEHTDNASSQNPDDTHELKTIAENESAMKQEDDVNKDESKTVSHKP